MASKSRLPCIVFILCTFCRNWVRLKRVISMPAVMRCSWSSGGPQNPAFRVVRRSPVQLAKWPWIRFLKLWPVLLRTAKCGSHGLMLIGLYAAFVVFKSNRAS